HGRTDVRPAGAHERRDVQAEENVVAEAEAAEVEQPETHAEREDEADRQQVGGSDEQLDGPRPRGGVMHRETALRAGLPQGKGVGCARPRGLCRTRPRAAARSPTKVTPPRNTAVGAGG